MNVSGAAFWSEPFNVPFLLGFGAAALLFTGAGVYSVDDRVRGRSTWPTAANGHTTRAGDRCRRGDLGGAERDQPDPFHGPVRRDGYSPVDRKPTER